ncbi:MAG: alpha-2-macroglobulin, partial [Bacteroidetes bacterium]
LKPGQYEEWMLRIEGPDGGPAPAEVVATLYDASLEAFASHAWPHDLWPRFTGHSSFDWEGMSPTALPAFRSFSYGSGGPDSRTYPELVPLDLMSWRVHAFYRMADTEMAPMEESAPATRKAEPAQAPPTPPAPEEAPPAEAAPQVAPRTQLDELVFFEPQLTTDAKGHVTIRFRMKEAITRWKFRALAHTKDLAMGYAERAVVTTKDLLIVPNAPRFVREGDRIGFTAKVVNNTDQPRHFNAALQLVDARTGMVVYKWLDNPQFNVEGEVPAHGSKDVQWWFEVPPADEVPLLEYTVEVSSADLIDAERSVLPVLPNRMLVTETQPITVGPRADERLRIERLRTPASPTMQPWALTLEFTPNPAWLAVKALPYLMEYPHPCSEQLFSRLYANTLASALANRQPRIREVFEQWQQAGAEALESPLAQNEELKAALLAETPWVLDALSENEQRQRIALLFDLHRMAFERAKAMAQLRDNQNGDGGWPWFQGGPSSRYITQYIVEGFGHLRKLQAFDPTTDEAAWPMIEAAIPYL